MRPTDEPDDDYSATVLASHWIQRPEEDTAPTVTGTAYDGGVRPDRIEGAVLRFGPGVREAPAHRTGGTPLPPPSPPRRRGLRRHALPALVVLVALALLAWQRLGAPLTVEAATVTAPPATVGCDGTADLVGTVTTNGRPGTLTYRWIRSDGTESGVLREKMARGQREARLRLLWTFEGTGRYEATAELRIQSPSTRTTTARFTYDCS